MPNEEAYTFYAVSNGCAEDEYLEFFDTFEKARGEAIKLREELIGDGGLNSPLSDTLIEKVQTFPMNRGRLLALMNKDVRKIIQKREAIATISDPQLNIPLD